MKGKRRGIIFLGLLVAILALTVLPVNMVFASSGTPSSIIGAESNELIQEGYVTGTVASVPVSTGGTDEYNLFLDVNGENIWIAATTTDFPNLLTVGATLTGILDFSAGWWTLTATGANTIELPGQVVGTVASDPVYTGTGTTYGLYLTIDGQEIWVAATTTDFPQLLTVGAQVVGYLEITSGWPTFRKDYIVTPPAPVPGSVVGIVSSAPSPTGATAEYDLYITVDGQQVWVAATTTDFPNLFDMGTTLTGVLSFSNGWWTFTKM
jgi:hypothetical protein